MLKIYMLQHQSKNLTKFVPSNELLMQWFFVVFNNILCATHTADIRNDIICLRDEPALPASSKEHVSDIISMSCEDTTNMASCVISNVCVYQLAHL